MKNFTRKLTALILSIMMLSSIVPSMGFAAEAENVVLNTLQNTLYKLSTDKSLNVGYIGGSITVGSNSTNVNTDSYRALTTAWIKEKFPEATVTELNASTGGTGSQYGLWRANADLKLGTENQPDLTFIEYAVNDAYDKQTKAQASFYMESLVNKLYVANPNMDIVILLSTDVNKRNEDNVFPQLVAHREVAERYGIPYIENGYKLYNEIYAANGNVKVTGETWKNDTVWCTYFSDIVHPTNEGHKKYSGYIQEYLTSVLLDESVTVPEKLTAKELPTPINADLASDSYVDTAKDKGYTAYDNQWTVNADTGAISATKANQIFNFSFKGTRLEVMSKATADYGDIAYTIDGVEYTKNLCHGDTKKIVALASGLTEGTHNVSIRTTDTTIPQGKTLTIEGFSIAGDSTKAGITVPAVNDDSTFGYYVLRPVASLQNLKFTNGNQTDTVGNKIMTSYSAMPDYDAPFFFQYDLSDVKGKGILSAAYIHGLKSGDPNLSYYDVPGDDLTVTYTDGKPDRIAFNSTAFASGKPAQSYSAFNKADYPGTEDASDDFNYKTTFTNYVKTQAATENSLATFMVYNTYANSSVSFSKSAPLLWIKVNEAPAVEISEPAQINEGENAVVTATITDANGISGITTYVDDALVAAQIAKDGDKYTISFAGLTAGTHTIKLVAVDKYGASAEEEVSVVVKMSFPSTAKGLLPYTQASNPDFKEHVEHQTTSPSDWRVVTDSVSAYSGTDLDLSKVKAPVYLSFDMNSIVDPDDDGVIDYEIDEAYLIAKGLNTTDINRSVIIYDIPSNDISISTIGTSTPPAIGDRLAWKNSKSGYEAFGALRSAGKLDDFTIPSSMAYAYDLTNHTKSVLAQDRTNFSIMIYDNRTGAGISFGNATDCKPSLYLSVKKKPELEIISAGTQAYVTGDAVFKAEVYDETGIEKVDFYLNDELKATVTEAVDNVYTWTSSDLKAGTYSLKVVATAVSGSTKTVTDIANIKGLNQIIKFTDRLAVDNISQTVTVPTSNSMVLYNKSGQDNEAYYSFDISSLKNKSAEIEKVYLVTNGKNAGRAGLVFNCNDYNLKTVTQYSDVSNITPSGNRIAYFNLDASTLSDKVNAISSTLYPNFVVYNQYQLMRHDITDFIQNSLLEDDTTLTLKFMAGNEAHFESQSPLYLYVEYKDDTPLVVDNGDTLKINVRPSRYTTPMADTTITVLVASYDADGRFEDVEIKTIDAKDDYTSYNVAFESSIYEVFVWDSLDTINPLTAPVINIREGE